MKIRTGPDDPIERDDDDKPKSGWVAMWETIAWVVFVLACFAYCSRAELVEVLK